LRVRQNIRDEVEAPTSTTSVQIKSLINILESPIVFDPEWLMVWDTLKIHCHDTSGFIPSITGIMIAWCDAYRSWLEREIKEDIVEKFLETEKIF
jgi:hypothetical protein